MKLRNILLGAVALLGFAACQNKEQDADPAVSVDVTSIEFDQAGGSQTISFTSAASWELRGAEDWLAANPTSGKGSSATQTITVEATPNTDKDREATLTIYSSPLAKKSITVTQKGAKGDGLVGDGSLENPFNASSARATTLALEADVVTTDFYYVKGYVSKIVQIETANYGNANFYITDTADGTGDDFYCFQILYLNGAKFTSEDQLKVGDEVVVHAQFVNYKGNTPETNGKGTGRLYSINGQAGDPIVDPTKGTPEGDGSEASPYNATAAIQAASALAADVESSDFYYIKGFVKSVKSIDTSSYGNANFYITDTAAGDTEEFYCFQIMYLNGAKFTSADQLKAGDEVVVYAKLVNYKGNTPETVGKGSGKLMSINGESGDPVVDPTTGTPEGDGTEANPYNATAALQAASALAADTPTESEVYIKGFVKSISSIDTGTYGNASFKITDTAAGDTDEFYVFRVMYIGGEKFSSEDQLKVGDEVVVYAKLVNYKGNTPETNAGGKIISINGSSEAADFITVSKESLTVTAAAGTVTFDINANVAWTVASDNADFTVEPASGEGAATVTVTYTENTTDAERSAKITVSSSVKNLEVAVKQAIKGEAGDPSSLDPSENETLFLLSKAEIEKACKTGTNSASYAEGTIASEGGDWTGNFATCLSNDFLQFRNNNASYLTSPEYSSNVKRIVVVVNEAKYKQSSAKDLRLMMVPVVNPSDLPTGKDENKKNITYTEEQWKVCYGSITFKSNGGAQTMGVAFDGETKQFSILAADGAMYVDAIYVFCAK